MENLFIKYFTISFLLFNLTKLSTTTNLRNFINSENSNLNENIISEEYDDIIKESNNNEINLNLSENFETTTITTVLSKNSSPLSSSSSQSISLLNDKVNLLSKQLNTLSTRRRDEYKMLENSLKMFVKKNSLEVSDQNLRNEVDELREEIKSIRGGAIANKERLTVQWLSQSIHELRTELSELQQMSNNISRDLQQKNQLVDDMNNLRSDFQTIRLELEALRSRQESVELLTRQLRDETLQNSEEIQKSFNQIMNKNGNNEIQYDVYKNDAEHKMRHLRLTRQQIHELESSQNAIKQKLNELQNHHFIERVRNLENLQKKLTNDNLNLTQQVNNLDKLHKSMLELLEDVETVQNKVDKSLPEVKREISKIEFNYAQLASEQNSMHEDGHTMAKSIQALAASISQLQNDKNIMKKEHEQIGQMKNEIHKLKSTLNIQKENLHKRIEKMEVNSKKGISNDSHISNEVKYATELVKELEIVEYEYRSILNKLPHDCSEINFNSKTENGLYLIAPIGQHNPILTRCDNQWTTIQRRYDGTVDFNRSWDEYATGFGTPSDEFWIGNEVLHHLTQKNCTKLKITMQDIYDNVWLAEYNNFYISSRDDGYRLSITGYSGNASDAFDYQNHMRFSSIDIDNDISNTNCAANYEGGWWFSHCQHANLNGRYNLGLTWFDSIRNEWIAVKSSHMMITQRKNCSSNQNNETNNKNNLTNNKNNKISNNNNNNNNNNNINSNVSNNKINNSTNSKSNNSTV